MIRKVLLILIPLLFAGLFNACKDESIPTALGDVISLVRIYDINNNNSAKDIRVRIQAGNTSMVDFFSIFLMQPDRVSSFSLEEAMASEPRFRVKPGPDLFVTLDETVLTVDGDQVSEPNQYLAVVLVEFKKEFNLINQLSEKSNALFLKPTELADLYVSSRNTNSIQMFDGQTGEYLGDFITPGSGQLEAPQDIFIGSNGNFFVTGRGNEAVKEYDGSTGAYVRDFTKGYLLDEPTKMSISPDGKLLVSQWGQVKSSVATFDVETGEFIGELIIGLNQGMDHFWLNQELYVVSFGSRDLKKFTPEGNFLGVILDQATLTGPVNLWGGGSDLFIADWSDGTVKRHNLISGNTNTFISGLTNVEGFAIDANRNIYLCDWKLNSINKYSSTGELIETLVRPGTLRQPNAIVFGPNRDPQD